MILEEVMDFHLGICVLFYVAVLPRLGLPIELAFFPSCGRVTFFIQGEGHFCMIDQGILRTEVVLNWPKFSQLIGFPAEEMLCLEGDYPCDGFPVLFKSALEPQACTP